MDKSIFLDIETQKSKDDVNWRYPEKMLFALAVTFDSINWYRTRYEADIQQLIKELTTFNKIIGFNLIDFDYRVLYAYDFSIKEILLPKTIDMLDIIYKNLWFRIKLDDLAKTTLGKWKSGDGIQSIIWWKEWKHELTANYCRQDVLLTKELYDFWESNGYIYYSSYGNKKKIYINRYDK